MGIKNLWILPTDKPSRLYLGNNGNFVFGMMQTSIQSRNDDFTNQNTHITSNKDINENDYIITKDGRLVQVSYLLSKDLDGAKKIILTTDQDLIKDGVQAIDDEFLEWFVKNSSCEEVEVNKLCYGALSGYADAGYKIIIPKEEPIQESYICPHTKVQCDDECCVSAEDCHIKSSIGILSEPKQRLEKYSERFDNKDNELVEGVFNPENWGRRLVKEKPKQETLEEFAERYTENWFENGDKSIELVIAGAKWQQEQIGNSEFLQKLRATLSDAEARRLIFETFKNK